MVQVETGDESQSVIVSGRNERGFRIPRAHNDNGGRNSSFVLRRKLDRSGLAVNIQVPADHYVGVAVCTSITEEGVLWSAIELIHPDPALNHRLFEEEGNDTVVAEWQKWGRELGLPLYIRAGNGDLVAYSQQVGGVMVGENNARRKLATQAARRPRFLNRRKLGVVS